MRQIIFRGKKRTGERWVYGGICLSNDAVAWIDENGEKIEVDPNTVGQYTGYSDPYGTPIYENDKIQTNAFNEPCIVRYGEYDAGHVGFYCDFASTGVKNAEWFRKDLVYWANNGKVVGPEV